VKVFKGYRPNPPKEYESQGLTNKGESPDYVGWVTPQGKVVLEWQTAYKSITIYENWESFYHITGHPEYGTRIEEEGG
jgi:hypothetical protein